MAIITKEYFQSEWQKDWILRALVLDHFIFWRGSRVDIQNIEHLRKFLAQHSIAHTKSELNGFLSIYASRGIFTNPNTPSGETGFINPEAYQLVIDTMLNDYNLERTIQPGYTVSDFLWDAYGNKKETEQKMAHSFETLFKEIFKIDVSLFAVQQGQKEEHDYLRLNWTEGTKNYAWWLGFLPGGFLKREDAVAEGLTTKMAFKIKTLATTAQYSEQFWTVVAVDVSQHTIKTAEEINDTFNLGASFNLSLVTTLIKLLTWVEKLEKAKFSNFMKNFSAFFVDQNCPISTSLGIRNIEKSIKENGKSN